MEENPLYSVSEEGGVRNGRSLRPLALRKNNRGIIYVGLTINSQQVNRSVAVLVAEHFLPPPMRSTFDTPIHLDGDRSNCHVNNLLWRPRWFAVHYHRQFNRETPQNQRACREIETGYIFKSDFDAAREYGLLVQDIRWNYNKNKPVFPTNRRFEFLDI